MAMEKSPPPAPHFLFVVSGIQGHINPARRLAARLMASAPAARVTFSTAVSAHRLMFPSLPSPAGEDVDDTGVAYVPHSDGYDDGYKPGVHARDDYMARTRAAGTESLSAIVAALAARGRPVTCIVYTFLVGAVDGGATLDSAPTPAADAAGGGGEGDAQGMVVEWCDQMKVLSHPAVGCFVTHCGWNSALESITRGVPMVAVPQWTDQPTVAWLVEARMGAGVRARLDGEGVVERGELQRCVELAMAGGGDGGVRARAERWRERAAEAVAAGGSSERNLRAFASGAVTQAVCSSR
ncbi:hypothetical protein OsI_23563 [Oryza sativa Indica Group]|uniref:Uncharacterized protein n=1 Tax=Oryza sativa subsp. indica TaxID=39946 RepID=B8B473_ORYSI|nr:hypothetical protein OsI_23563 [Oryza sativa Indica Group]